MFLKVEPPLPSKLSSMALLKNSGITLRDLDPKTVQKIISGSLKDLRAIQDKHETVAK
jgi:hypothetical protein